MSNVVQNEIKLLINFNQLFSGIGRFSLEYRKGYWFLITTQTIQSPIVRFSRASR